MRILVECFADNLLIQKMGYQKDENHSNIGEVANRMIRKYRHEPVLGIIDNNQQNTPKYFDDFTIIRENHAIRFLK